MAWMCPAEDEYQRRAKLFWSELHAAKGDVTDSLRTSADHEDVAESAVEHELWRHAGVDAGKDHRERVLALREGLAALY
jgi:hypothetical protein